MASMLASSTQISLAARARVAPGSTSFRTARAAVPARVVARRAQRLVVRAEEGETDDDDFEAKLKALSGKKTSGSGVKAAERIAKKEGKDVALEEAYATTDFTGEEVYYEGPPAKGDLITNVVLGATLLWLPLTLASVGRYTWLKYKFTSKRIVSESTSPLETGVTQILPSQIKKVVTIGRGLGFWGDMVITLKNGENVEFRAVPDFKDLESKVKALMDSPDEVDADVKGF